MRGGADATTGVGLSRRALPALSAFVACLLADIWSKHWALDNLSRGETVPFIPGLLDLTLTTNTGAAFSLGAGNGSFMGILAAVLTTALAVWIVRAHLSPQLPPIGERIGMGLLLGGATGNLIDRLFAGRVTDFLDFAFVSFPVFNVADALIDTGIGLILLSVLFIKDGGGQPVKTEGSDGEKEERRS